MSIPHETFNFPSRTRSRRMVIHAITCQPIVQTPITAPEEQRIASPSCIPYAARARPRHGRHYTRTTTMPRATTTATMGTVAHPTATTETPSFQV